MERVCLMTGLRGAEHALYNGYMYTKRRTSLVNSVQWRCTHYAKFKCNGSLRTGPYPYENPCEGPAHPHPPRTVTGEVLQMRMAARVEATSSQGKPVNVLSSALMNLSDEAKAEVGPLESIKRDVRRKRTETYPSVPNNGEDWEIPDEWKTTGGTSSKRFLIFDSGSGNPERICIFGTVEGLAHLTSSKVWFMDGTFKACPKMFQQLYVIRGDCDNLVATCVYGLMKRKTVESYKILLSNILVKVAELGLFAKPEIILTDFEAAAMAAVRIVFENKVLVRGCYFHLCQSTWRKIQELGLVSSYKNDPKIKLFCGMMDALAFLPIKDVKEGMSYLWGSAPVELFELLHYFDITYVSGIDGQPPADPMFPIDVWNVHEATITNSHRTNNNCESWNHRFNNLVGHSNPSIWTVITAMRKDSALETARCLASTPEATRSRKNQHIYQRRLHTYCMEYVAGARDLGNFLKAVGQTIRYK